MQFLKFLMYSILCTFLIVSYIPSLGVAIAVTVCVAILGAELFLIRR